MDCFGEKEMTSRGIVVHRWKTSCKIRRKSMCVKINCKTCDGNHFWSTTIACHDYLRNRKTQRVQHDTVMIEILKSRINIRSVNLTKFSWIQIWCDMIFYLVSQYKVFIQNWGIESAEIFINDILLLRYVARTRSNVEWRKSEITSWSISLGEAAVRSCMHFPQQVVKKICSVSPIEDRFQFRRQATHVCPGTRLPKWRFAQDFFQIRISWYRHQMIRLAFVSD